MWRYIRLNKKIPENKLRRAFNTTDRRASCTNGDCASRATVNSDRSATSRVWHKTKKRKQRKTRGRHPSANKERHHSCQFVQNSSWHMFCHQICHVFHRTQIVHQDETELVQLLNANRLHNQVFCSTPWPKTLHDGHRAAAVRPNFEFERSCCMVLQQLFLVQIQYNPS